MEVCKAKIVHELIPQIFQKHLTPLGTLPVVEPAPAAFGMSKKPPCMRARFPNLRPTGSWWYIKKLSMPACWDPSCIFRVFSVCPVCPAVALLASNGLPSVSILGLKYGAVAHPELNVKINSSWLPGSSYTIATLERFPFVCFHDNLFLTTVALHSGFSTNWFFCLCNVSCGLTRTKV